MRSLRSDTANAVSRQGSGFQLHLISGLILYQRSYHFPKHQSISPPAVSHACSTQFWFRLKLSFAFILTMDILYSTIILSTTNVYYAAKLAIGDEVNAVLPHNWIRIGTIFLILHV